MTNPKGRNVRLFLVDGTPTGLIAAEIMNWTGHVLAGSRSGLENFLKRPELNRTGIYLLLGQNPEDSDSSIVYIGESDTVRERLRLHNKDESKNYWERTCVITSKDSNITKAHARYLEARLIQIVKDLGHSNLGNVATPDPVNLPEADKSDMEFFIEQIQLILPVLGFDFLRSDPSISPIDRDPSKDTTTGGTDESPLFEIATRDYGIMASARESNGEFVVLKGSFARAKWQDDKTTASSPGKKHGRLIREGKLSAVDDSDSSELLQFTSDVPFKTPSGASSVIWARHDNGRKSWRVKGSDATYADWQEKQIESIVSDDENS